MSLITNGPIVTMPYDVTAHHARNVIQSYNDNLKQTLGIPLNLTSVRLQPALTHRSESIDPVGVIGAGAAGLYTALMLEELGIPYRILEARNRVGGRLFTYKFPNPTGAPYNYYDIGAMRFPDVLAMKRVFDLFDHPGLNTPDIALKKKLRPYYYSGTGKDSAFFSYNGVVVRKNEVPSGDPFKASAVIKDEPDAQQYIAVGPNAIMNDVAEPFARALYKDLETGGTEGWEFMMKYDHHSVRSYMIGEYKPSDNINIPKKTLSVDVVNWIETYVDPKDRFDRALTDFVLDMISFGWQPDSPPPAKWYLIDGGSQEIANSLHKYLLKRHPDRVILNTKVTSMALNEESGYMDIVTDNKKHHRFSHVVSTLPLPVMRTVELKDAGLTPLQANALRQLNYAPAIKIGMQFKTAWWTTANSESGRKLNIIGGQSSTDTPLQTIVYPSFGDALHGKTPTMIASYSTMEEAMRTSAWIKDNTEDSVITEPSDDQLVHLVVRELAKVHNVTEDFLHDQLIATKPWSWNNDPYTMGAFGFFGPGKFENLYTSLTDPAAKGYLHFAGEAISTRHAWVAGALDSAWRAVREMLLFPPFQKYEKTFFEKFGVNPEWVKGNPSRNTPVRIPHAQEDLVLEHLALTHPELF